jgi:hypothetical protein
MYNNSISMDESSLEELRFFKDYILFHHLDLACELEGYDCNLCLSRIR